MRASTYRNELSVNAMNPARMLCSILAAAMIATLAGLAPAAWAAPAAPPANDTCLTCHADKDAKNAAGQSIAVEGDKFAASVHGQMKLECTSCHADVSPHKIPHADKLKPVDCGTCHGDAVKEYTGTVHGKARNGGNTMAAGCTDCHGKHDIKRAKDADSRTNHANLEATCGKCHGNDALVQKAHLPGGNVASQFHDSIHGKALAGAAQGSAPTCTNCHGAHTIRAKGDEKSKTSRANIPSTCGACHEPVQQAFLRSQHGKLRQGGNMAAPGCNDCHSAHQIQQHEAPKFVTGVVEQCGTCHQDYLTTYRDTYHGQVTKLGFSRMATCASCHGSHEILPASDARSTIAGANRVKTCQACHEGAGIKFASYDPHANREDRARNPIYYYSAKFMEWLLIGVFGAFGLHTILWLGRELVDSLGRRVRGGQQRKEK